MSNGILSHIIGSKPFATDVMDFFIDRPDGVFTIEQIGTTILCSKKAIEPNLQFFTQKGYISHIGNSYKLNSENPVVIELVFLVNKIKVLLEVV